MASGKAFSSKAFREESTMSILFSPNVFEHFFRHLNVRAERRIGRIYYVEQKGGVQRFVESRPE